jgi:UDP-GlcNAc:undecaprenyl-phosphate GlcNAc-1-phosphate transferase
MLLQALSFPIALAISLALMPLVRRVSFRLGKVAYPRKDRWHTRPTPILGGVGFFAAFVITLLVSSILSQGENPVNWGLLAGSLVMFLLGLLDDFVELTPPTKLVGQILAAAVVIALGYTTAFFTPRIENTLVAQIPNILLTFVWLVGITNAINLLDNMDGLAGGISLITAVILSFFFWRTGDESLFLLSMALAGSVLGFLVFNFPPAKVFMGDSGSLFLGFTLAVLAIARQPQASNVFAVLGVPTLLFMLPILDTTLVTFTRLLRGQSPAQGGPDHTSHRLIAFGLTERQTVLVLYGVALASGFLAALLESLDYDLSLLLFPLVLMVLALLTAYLGRLKVFPPASGSSQDGTEARGSAITRLMVELTYRRRVLEMIFDLFLIGIAYYLAFWSRFGLSMSEEALVPFLRSLPLAVAGSYLSFFIFGVYRGVWRYVGLDELVRFAIAAAGAAALTAVSVVLVYSRAEYSLLIFGLFGVYLFLMLAGTRSSFRVLDLMSGRQARPAEERVLICGAGDAGEMALRWIQMNPQLGYRPVGFLDGDPYKVGRRIHGVEILGDYSSIQAQLDALRVDGVVLTADIGGADGALEQLIQTSHEHGLWVRSLRLEFELVE